MFDPTRPFIDDNFVSLTICQNAICLLKLCSCNSCGAKQENRYKSVQMVDRCLWITRWSILKPFLAFVATTVVLIRLVFMTIRRRDTAVKRDISCKMVKIKSNCQLWNFNQERKNDDCQKCWSKTNLMNDTTCVPVNFPRSPNWLSVGFVVTDKSYRAILEKSVFYWKEEFFVFRKHWEQTE